MLCCINPGCGGAWSQIGSASNQQAGSGWVFYWMSTGLCSPPMASLSGPQGRCDKARNSSHGANSPVSASGGAKGGGQARACRPEHGRPPPRAKERRGGRRLPLRHFRPFRFQHALLPLETRQFLSSPMKQPEVRLLGVGAASALRARGAASPGATAAAEHVTGQPIPGRQADGDLWLRD